MLYYGPDFRLSRIFQTVRDAISYAIRAKA
jgi:hypothetical protein